MAIYLYKRPTKLIEHIELYEGHSMDEKTKYVRIFFSNGKSELRKVYEDRKGLFLKKNKEKFYIKTKRPLEVHLILKRESGFE